MTNPVQQAQSLGQSIWYDNIRRGLIRSGELQKLIDLGVSGLTSNPTIFEKAIAGSTDYDEALLSIDPDGSSPADIFESLALDDIRAAADLLRPIYDRTEGADGFASLEVSPHLSHDTDGTVAEARRLHAALDRPNVMVKVPATPEGIPAIRRLIAEGISVNVTLIFSLDSYRDVQDAYIGGLGDLLRSGGDVSRVASVASFFVSRVDSAVDALLEERVRAGQSDAAGLQGKAAIANARLAYKAFEDTFRGERFAALRAGGARVQRPLWASTGTKNAAYSDVLYVESLIGPDTVNTVPEATLMAFADHGRAESTLALDVDGAAATMDALRRAGVDIDSVTSRLLADGLDAFVSSYDKLLENIQDKMARLLAGTHSHPGVHLGDLLPVVESTVANLQRDDIVARLWHKDHTVWQSDPREITDRLGWVRVTDIMLEQVPSLENFAQEVRDAGFRHVVLLGMGGSSLGPEVLRQTFGSASGSPELIVLDSTVPAWVQSVADRINPAKTLFLVSSKSGTTTEPNTFYRYFRGLVDDVVGDADAGRSFVAITDPETALVRLAESEGFRRVFVNPPDIGGRYSVLSYFGLVPAALMGIDLNELIDRADCMREGCHHCVPAHDNPGAWLGAAIGSIAAEGRDKLTFVASPSVGSFGLWGEQLIAESLGKQGKGIVPVAGEPLAAPDAYGDDRIFAYLRVENDDNAETDAFIQGVESSGQPVIRLDLRDKYDLGAEFFRWEFATAIAGSVLGLHPFDQPDVQAAKDMTSRMIDGFKQSGSLPAREQTDSFSEVMSSVKRGDYLAIMAYILQTPETDAALNALRSEITKRHRVPTTLGYGPRFLHSTGQLHKGGPNSGVFVQLTADHTQDVPIQGEPHTFKVLADAQAMGDLEALKTAGRRVVSVNLGEAAAEGIRGLANQVADSD